MTDSQELYNLFAPYYRPYSKRKKRYIETVNKIIINNLPSKTNSILDIGAGDGVRGAKLYKTIGARELIQIDNSRGMLKIMQKGKGISHMMLDISDDKLPKKLGKYDVILCLWNVLGHIETQEARLMVLKNIRLLLNPRGSFFIDVSNRYNAKYYGWKNALRNLYRDAVSPSIHNGDFKYIINISENLNISTKNHFFSPGEMRSLFKKSGFKILKKHFVDYENGEIQKFPFKGQLVYILN